MNKNKGVWIAEIKRSGFRCLVWKEKKCVSLHNGYFRLNPVGKWEKVNRPIQESLFKEGERTWEI